MTSALNPDSILPALIEKDDTGRKALARLWLSEGVPIAFDKCPAIFDAIRVWLGDKLSVSPKIITIVGSARTGFSLSPPPKYGKPFSPSSDLDIAIVSNELFSKVCDDFKSFKEDYKTGRISPRNDREAIYWPENIDRVPSHMINGFIDVNKIPYLDRYTHVRLVSQTMWRLTERLKNTPQAPQVSKASVRVYREWTSLVNRVAFNLGSSAQKPSLPKKLFAD